MLRKVHASSPPAGPAVASPPPTAADWATEAVDRIDELVERVRSNTTDRLVKVARVVVYGLFAAILGITALILLTIALVRALNELIPGPVWVVYLGLGAMFSAAGALLWSMKTRRPAGDDAKR